MKENMVRVPHFLQIPTHLDCPAAHAVQQQKKSRKKTLSIFFNPHTERGRFYDVDVHPTSFNDSSPSVPLLSDV